MAGSRTLKLSILADVDDLKKKLGQGETEVSSFGDKLGEFGKKAAAAFAVAAAAAAAYAGKLLVDGVKAAIEDEKAQAKLATTLQNVTGATDKQIASVEEQIKQLSLANGIADDELRPSFERLVRATEDVTKAQNLQKLALDVAAGSGKSLESVSAALAKAYDGNTSALTRLGVGLSTAELKSMTFDEVTKKLSDTFGGQATVQAETFEGRMQRLQVAFDEAKESIGARLLPILTNLVTYFTDNVGPIVDTIKDKIKPLTTAIADNKDEFEALWDFIKTYLVPFMSGALKTAFTGIVASITTLVNILGNAINFFGDLYDAYKKVVDFIKNNPLSKWLGSINPFNNTSSTGSLVITGASTSKMGGSSNANTATGTSSTGWVNGFAGGIPFTPSQAFLDQVARTEELKAKTAEIRAKILARQSGNTEPIVTINVNAPSAIDQEGFTRSVIDALNSSELRTGSLGTLLV
jgi:hypothetical protein